ncbi:hypothetical protein ABI59_11990 [Acidobacteria bacterium Mor1]|nr:hypothetical protein ABI59_11990 [Acidobacteria bacterium Mor1]
MSTEAAAVVPGRQETLRPYLDKLFSIGGKSDGSDRPLNITIGSHSLAIDAWEREILRDILAPEETPSWQPLLAEGLALQTKLLSDLARYESKGDSAPEEARTRMLTELCNDATIAYALMTEMQSTIGEMVLSGRMEDAKRLTQHRNKLSQNLGRLTPVLGEPAMRTAKSTSADLVAASKEAGAAAGPVDSHEERTVQELLAMEEALQAQPDSRTSNPTVAKAKAQGKGQGKGKGKGKGAKVKEGAKAEEKKAKALPARFGVKRKEDRQSSAGKLIAVLAVALIAWVALQGVPMMNRVEIPEVTIADFSGMNGVTQIMARPPSVYVQVDSYAWGQMAHKDRVTLVESIGHKIEGMGYVGAHIQGDNGRTLAQWLQKTGTTVHELPTTAAN